ncbi:PilW family protein [Candidatus Margulisiibacteriota bacterium]
MLQINKKGLTLIEMIIATLVAGIIVGIFAVVINSGMDAWFFIKGQKSIMSETRAVLKRMVREIRRTKDADNILTFTTTNYEFNDIEDNTIDYQQDGTNLERNDAALLTNLASSDGLEFVYLDANGNVAASEGDIRTVQITIIVHDGDNEVRLRSAAGLRNR